MQTECSANEIDFGRAAAVAWWRILTAEWFPPTAGRFCSARRTEPLDCSNGSPPALAIGATPFYVVYPIKTLIAQRVFGLALGYEDLINNDELRRDPVLGVLLGTRSGGARAARRQEHAEPPGARASRGRADPLSQNRPRRRGDRAAFCRSVSRRAFQGAVHRDQWVRIPGAGRQ